MSGVILEIIMNTEVALAILERSHLCWPFIRRSRMQSFQRPF